ncbi:MAG: LysR family transcriptional regulator [Rhodobacteraceae bacterium]|nr:LysR family transcriptional regulator [Paracoccaceae bacterium]
MDLHRLGLISTRVQHFQLTARLGSIRAAARALNMTPSSVSRSIRALEDDLRAPLFERGGQQLRLSSAGEMLLYHLGQSTVELGRAVTGIADLRGLRRGTVTLVSIESAARGLLPRVLADFWARNPEIAVDVRVTSSADAASMVASGDADLALSFDQQSSRNLRRIAMAGLALGVLVPPGSRLTKITPGPALSDLSGERVILSDSSLTLGRSVEAAMGDAFVDFARRGRTNSIALMIELAELGLGTVMQTRLGAEREIAAGSLVFLPLHERRIGLRRLMLMARPKAELSEAATALSAALGQAVDALSPDE